MTTENTNQVKPLFELGQTLSTPGALSTMQEMNINPSSLLSRHICGDWQGKAWTRKIKKLTTKP